MDFSIFVRARRRSVFSEARNLVARVYATVVHLGKNAPLVCEGWGGNFDA